MAQQQSVPKELLCICGISSLPGCSSTAYFPGRLQIGKKGCSYFGHVLCRCEPPCPGPSIEVCAGCASLNFIHLVDVFLCPRHQDLRAAPSSSSRLTQDGSTGRVGGGEAEEDTDTETREGAREKGSKRHGRHGEKQSGSRNTAAQDAGVIEESAAAGHEERRQSKEKTKIRNFSEKGSTTSRAPEATAAGSARQQAKHQTSVRMQQQQQTVNKQQQNTDTCRSRSSSSSDSSRIRRGSRSGKGCRLRDSAREKKPAP